MHIWITERGGCGSTGKRLWGGIAILLCGQLAGVTVPFSVEGPNVDPADFTVTVFASGLNYPNGMAELPDGSLIVTTGDEVGDYFSGIGRLIRLVDTNADGVADGPPQILYDGMAPTLTAVGMADDLVFATGSGAPLYIFRTGALPSDPLSLLGTVDFDYSASKTYHGHTALTVRKVPGIASRYDLFFQLGGEENFVESTDIIPISSSDVINTSGSLARAAAHMLTLQDHGTHMEMISVVQIASGLRNASGFAIHPTRGDLWFNDNGIDGLVDSNEPLSADELNHIPRMDIGTEVWDFGFPDNYTEYRTGTVVGGAGIQPDIAFQPYGDPETGLRSEGPNAITFAPPGFPAGLNTGIFVGFHGKFLSGGLNNDENPVVYADPQTGEYFHFIRGQQEGIGHMIGLLATRHALYVADISPGGNILSGAAGQGVIYRIRSNASVPPEYTFERSGNSLILEWDRGGIYQSQDLDGDWQLVEDVFSPYSLERTANARFFRFEY